jgi:hypothetical protein
MSARRHLSACGGFWLWALPGALLMLMLVAAASIGIFVLPFALVAFWRVSRSARGRDLRGSTLGVLAGAGITIIAIGLLHVGESRCLTNGAAPPGASACTDFDPQPWLLAGCAALVLSAVLFSVARRR